MRTLKPSNDLRGLNAAVVASGSHPGVQSALRVSCYASHPYLASTVDFAYPSIGPAKERRLLEFFLLCSVITAH